jgi:hypothetical protein
MPLLPLLERCERVHDRMTRSHRPGSACLRRGVAEVPFVVKRFETRRPRVYLMFILTVRHEERLTLPVLG